MREMESERASQRRTARGRFPVVPYLGAFALAACGGEVEVNPVSWRRISPPAGVDMEFRTTEARGGRASYTAVWNRDRVWFWGGYRGERSDDTALHPADQGAVYLPETDEWLPWRAPDSSIPAVIPRAEHFAFADGTVMVVVGGKVPAPDPTGGMAADPIGDVSVSKYQVHDGRATWWNDVPPPWPGYPTPNVPAGTTPSFIVLHESSGARVAYQFGLRGESGPDTFGTSGAQGPPLLSQVRNERADRTLFIGSTILDGGIAEVTSGSFDSNTRMWEPLETPKTLTPRTGHTFVNQIVWGGLTEAGVTNDGEAVRFEAPPRAGPGDGYDCCLNPTINGVPSDDGSCCPPGQILWAPITREGAPSPRARHAAVAVGRRMLIFGGARPRAGATRMDWLNDGGIYDPKTDTWMSLPAVGAPPALQDPIALWTRQEQPPADPKDPAFPYYWHQNAVIIWGTSVDDPAKGAGAILMLPDDWGY